MTNQWDKRSIARDQVEPTAAQRSMARELFALHVALTNGGFSEAQSLVILGQMVQGAASRDSDT